MSFYFTNPGPGFDPWELVLAGLIVVMIGLAIASFHFGWPS